MGSRRAQPRWGWTGVQKVPQVELKPEEMSRLAGLLGISDDAEVTQTKARLEYLASRYLRWKSQDECGPSVAQQNAALLRIEDLAGELATALVLLDTASYDILAGELEHNKTEDEPSGEPGWQRLDRDREHVMRLADCARRAPSLIKSRRGPRPMVSLPLLVKMLAGLYEEATDRRFTHTPYRATEYRSVPMSAAGKFICTFINIIDPEVPDTQVSTAMAQVVRARRAQAKDT